MIEIAGPVMSGFELLVEIAKQFKDMSTWKEVDLSVDADGLELASPRGSSMGRGGVHLVA